MLSLDQLFNQAQALDPFLQRKVYCFPPVFLIFHQVPEWFQLGSLPTQQAFYHLLSQCHLFCTEETEMQLTSCICFTGHASGPQCKRVLFHRPYPTGLPLPRPLPRHLSPSILYSGRVSRYLLVSVLTCRSCLAWVLNLKVFLW